jgi:hypothetical protein
VASGLLCLSTVLSPPAVAQTVRVEAESYQNYGSGSGLSKTGGSSGIGLETRDAVGMDGQRVSGAYVTYLRNTGGATGNTGLFEYLEYKVTVPSDGMYQIKVRGAYPAGNIMLRIWDLSYGVIFEETLDMTPSGGLFAENMAQLTCPDLFPMKAGEHTIRIYAMRRGINPDWFEFTRQGDLTGFGLVTGKVTDGTKGIGPAQVYSAISTANDGLPTSIGYRAISDAGGNYKLLLPEGNRSLIASASGYDDPLGLVDAVNVVAGTPAAHDLTVTYNGRTETEWFTDAKNASVPNGFGYGSYDRAGSWNQVIGQFQMPGFYLDYEVTVPSDGLYTMTLYHTIAGTDPNVRLLDVATSTGYWAEDALSQTGASAIDPYAFLVPLPLKAGKNTVSIIQPTLTSHNVDYFTLTGTGSPFGTLNGTVHNTDGGAAEAGVTVTVTDSLGKIVGKRVTDAAGAWTILAAPGDYTVAASKSGLDGTTATVSLAAGATTSATVSVSPSDTITILPQDLASIFNGANEVPRIYYPYPSPTGQTIGNLGTDSWAEFPFNASKSGTYSITVLYSAGNAAVNVPANRTLVVDIRRDGSDQHFATEDLVLVPTGDNHVYLPFTANNQVPLQAGKYILRVHNVTGLHDFAPLDPQVSTSSTNVASVTLARTGEAPAMASLTGSVSSGDLGIKVANAMVLANPPGSEVAVPSRFSYHGYWTTADANGRYQLSVPVGAYTVQAARPDTYVNDGATVSNVNVAAGGATANPSRTSKWVDGVIRVEAEYYYNKVAEAPGSGSGTGVQMIPDAAASNGYRLGAIGDEDWIDVHVDVPSGAAGSYALKSFYFNLPTPGTAGRVRYTANDGAAVEVLHAPNADNTAPSSIAADGTVPLKAGLNTVRIYKVNGATDFDAVELTHVIVPMSGAMRALRIAGGLDAATMDDMTALNVVTTGTSAGVIDLLDAVELARE